MGESNIILIGMRGSGKSTLGSLLAKETGRDFFDTDNEIEKASRRSITDIVQNSGWKAFRDMEAKMYQQMGEKESGVISTGAGVILRKENIFFLKKNGLCIFLFVDPQRLIERIQKQQTDYRPSLTGKGVIEEIQEIWKERKHLYYQYADKIIDANGSRKEVIAKLLKCDKK
jgi:shikimate kinase